MALLESFICFVLSLKCVLSRAPCAGLACAGVGRFTSGAARWQGRPQPCLVGLLPAGGMVYLGLLFSRMNPAGQDDHGRCTDGVWPLCVVSSHGTVMLF